MGLTKMQRAAHKAWATRRRNAKVAKPKRKGAVVGFYKDKRDRTRPITKPVAMLKRKKVIQKPKTMKSISPKGKKLWVKEAKKGMKVGALTELGYDPWLPARRRSEVLNRSIEKVGLQTTRKRIQFLANISQKKDLKERYTEDLAFIDAKLKAEKPKKSETLKQGSPKFYRMTPLKTWRRRSKSNPNVWYTIRLNRDGTLSCNCKGWIFSKAPKSCSHTKEIHEEKGVG